MVRIAYCFNTDYIFSTRVTRPARLPSVLTRKELQRRVARIEDPKRATLAFLAQNISRLAP